VSTSSVAVSASLPASIAASSKRIESRRRAASSSSRARARIALGRRRARGYDDELIEERFAVNALGGGPRPRLALHSRTIRLMTEDASPPAYGVAGLRLTRA